MILQMTRAVQGGLRQERKLDIIANHLANSDTNGFKGDILAFDDMFKANLVTDHSQGDLKVTDNKLDLAINGNGFFKVQTQLGIQYTRDGNLTVDQNGTLVTQNGDPVLGNNAPIVIQGTEIHISQAGEVIVDGDAIGNLDVVTFEDLTRLKKTDKSMFRYEGDAGADEQIPQNVSVEQGSLEKPNISTTIEMVEMIQTHRMYEAYQKMIMTFDEIDSKAILELGRP
ncbi:MAG: flagellar hook-basal body protein [Desulfobacterium sp.]|nr:flagellar hook-basal body protein [Desulfobacterium sp.]